MAHVFAWDRDRKRFPLASAADYWQAALAAMREQISKDAAPTVSYATRDGRTVSVTATLKGLSTAVKAIN